MSIGALARMAGVRPSAIRYYEAAGVLAPAARRGGRRCYGDADRQVLGLVLEARRLGFSVGKLRALQQSNADELRAAAGKRATALRATIAQAEADAARLERLAACTCSDVRVCALLADV